MQSFLYVNILLFCEAIRNIFSIVFEPDVHLLFHFALIPLTSGTHVPEELPDQKYTTLLLVIEPELDRNLVAGVFGGQGSESINTLNGANS